MSPRIPPSWKGYESICDSHEHTEDGHITEDQLIRTKMVEKRFKKLEGIAKELDQTLMIGPDKADILLDWLGIYLRSNKGSYRIIT